MSERAEKHAWRLFPILRDTLENKPVKYSRRDARLLAYTSYRQAEKDTIERVVKWLEENNIGYNYSESSFDCGDPAELIKDLKKALEEE